nr:vegetative cell wall protein gp1-like [Aegilops tauschii subsp. strangulata]
MRAHRAQAVPHTAPPARAQGCLAPGLPCLSLPLPHAVLRPSAAATASTALLPSPPATAQASPCHRCPFPASGPSPWPRPAAPSPPGARCRRLLPHRRPFGLGDSAPVPARP